MHQALRREFLRSTYAKHYASGDFKSQFDVHCSYFEESGHRRLINFEYMDKPNTKQLQNSLIMLRYLEAVSSSGRLTNLGRELGKLPIDPCFAKALLYGELLDNSKRSKVQEDMLKLVSVLSTENIFANVSRNDSRAQ